MRQAREIAAQIRRVVLPKIESDEADDALQG